MGREGGEVRKLLLARKVYFIPSGASKQKIKIIYFDYVEGEEYNGISLIFWEGNGFFIMYAISYLELNSCCLIIMMLILHKQVRGLDKRLTSQTFTELIVSAMVYVFLDMIYGLQQNSVIHLPVTVSKIVNVMMFVSLYSLTHLVFAFMECELGRTWVEDSKKRQLSLIPALILTIMTICSLKWHFFFYVDAEGIFQRGAFYGVIIPFVYIYIFW